MNWVFLLTIFVSVYTSAGQSVTLNMPSYSTLNSRDMRITCKFQTDDQFTIITLLNGNENNNLVTTYVFVNNEFEISGGTSVRLDVEPGTTFQRGSLTFVFSRVNCPDFTWYVCSGSGSTSGVDVDSSNITLQISPEINSLMKTSSAEIVVNQISNFVCRGTVRKEGPFSIQWYRRTITNSSQIQVEQAKVIGQNECSRSVSSTLSYNVSETDPPNLVLWCRIDAEQRIDKMMNFTVQDLPVKLHMPSYSTLNSTDMRITCEFQAEDQFTVITLLNGNNALVATYTFTQQTFEMVTGSSVRLEVAFSTTYRGGALTFVFPRVNCLHLTWYVCRASGSITGPAVYSTNITLQISPRIDSIMKTSSSDLVANLISNFECRGTVGKEGPFSIQWYRRTLTTSSQIQVEQAKVIGQNECSRSVSSSLSYNVSETDPPNLVLWCRIDAGQRIDKMMNFTVQGQSVTLNMPSYIALNSRDMRITCEFQTDDLFTIITLLNGNKALVASYPSTQQNFEMVTDSSVRLEVGSGTTYRKGSLTFVFPRVNYLDFTWYICRGSGSITSPAVYSTNITLQKMTATAAPSTPKPGNGQSVTLNMPSYIALNSRDMRITCEFQTDDQFTIITLLNGNKALVASYTFTQQIFKMVTDSSVRLEVGSGTTYRKGSLTFVFPRVNYLDFTWYICRGSGSITGPAAYSTNIILQKMTATAAPSTPKPGNVLVVLLVWYLAVSPK